MPGILVNEIKLQMKFNI